MKKLVLVIMSCCLFFASGNTFAYTRSDCGKANKICKYYKSECRKGRVYKGLNIAADIFDAMGPGPKYLDQNDRIMRRKIYKQGKQDCEKRDKQCKMATRICSGFCDKI